MRLGSKLVVGFYLQISVMWINLPQCGISQYFFLGEDPSPANAIEQCQPGKDEQE
jgi:hypothetical protein